MVPLLRHEHSWLPKLADEELKCRGRAWVVFFGAALANTEEERHRRMGVGIVDALRFDAQDG